MTLAFVAFIYILSCEYLVLLGSLKASLGTAQLMCTSAPWLRVRGTLIPSSLRFLSWSLLFWSQIPCSAIPNLQRSNHQPLLEGLRWLVTATQNKQEELCAHQQSLTSSVPTSKDATGFKDECASVRY